MKIYITSYFSRWLKAVSLSDEQLCSAIKEMQQGLIDADLGGNIYKKGLLYLLGIKVVVQEI